MPAAAASPTNSPCPVCEGSGFVAAFGAVGKSFERCRGCGFVRMCNGLAGEGLERFYHSDEASAAAAQQDHTTNLERFARILAAIERRREKGLFVDVGCSIGTSLVVARQRGWRVLGLELSAKAAATARSEHGLDVRECTLGDAGLAPGSVDAVLMHHTLEHVERPDEVLRQVFEVLAPGGVMYQSLPNHGSLKARLLGPHFGYGVTDEHLSHFSLRTLRRLVRRVGFRVQSTSTWSYRQDPRLLWDFCCRIGRREWLQRKCGVPLDRPMDVASYIRFLHEHRWAFFVCNRLWPARLCRWLGLGEDLHLVATKP
jgi:2-polyprenyl-3-methyl-5-hydroxy-6-metoxy-1,4-benzoquinol methylase